MIPPLAIVQARIGSTRLPGKMLLPLNGKPLVFWAWEAAVQAFGAENVVCAIPAGPENDALAEVFKTPDFARYGAHVFRWDGPESDVLGRLLACARTYRWRPDSVIVRVTPDDPRKDPAAMRRVAGGTREPVEIGGEAFTLAMLESADWRTEGGAVACIHNGKLASMREHITYALFDTPAPPAPPGLWTIDTPEQYEEAKRMYDPPKWPEPKTDLPYAETGAPFEP